jgi:hypothetical protein
LLRSARLIYDRPVRRFVVLLSTIALTGAFSLALTAPSAMARDHYCSPSGDWCTFTSIKNGKRTFELRSFFGHLPIRICVTRTSRVCRYRTLVRDRGAWANRILWNRFPYQGHGTYHVKWFVDFDNTGAYTHLAGDLTF